MSATLRYGMITAFVLIILSLIGSLIGPALGILSGILMISAFTFMIVRGMKERRDAELGGTMTYGRALGTGMMIALMCGLIYGCYTGLGIKFWEGENLEKQKEQIFDEYERQLDDGEITQKDYEMMVEVTEFFLTPVFLAISTVISFLFGGLIVSLIAAAFAKRDPPPVIQGVSPPEEFR